MVPWSKRPGSPFVHFKTSQSNLFKPTQFHQGKRTATCTIASPGPTAVSLFLSGSLSKSSQPSLIFIWSESQYGDDHDSQDYSCQTYGLPDDPWSWNSPGTFQFTARSSIATWSESSVAPTARTSRWSSHPPKNYNNHHHHNNNVDFSTHLAIRAVLTIKCKNIFAKVPDYLEATIYDKENAVIMVKPGQLILFGFEWNWECYCGEYKRYNCVALKKKQVGNLADVKTIEQKEKINHVTRWVIVVPRFNSDSKLFHISM